MTGSNFPGVIVPTRAEGETSLPAPLGTVRDLRRSAPRRATHRDDGKQQ